VKSINTTWHGYSFRSRLEARWAIFFTKMKMAFDYEPEGFEFEDGTLYLPDFLLPEIRMWAEVKPFGPTSEEIHKAEKLASESKLHVLWLVGPPDFRHYRAITSDSGSFSQCDYSLDIYFHNRLYYDVERRLYSDPDPRWITEEEVSEEYRTAVWLSRAERFEREEVA
jgi:hypothetical protein